MHILGLDLRLAHLFAKRMEVSGIFYTHRLVSRGELIVGFTQTRLERAFLCRIRHLLRTQILGDMQVCYLPVPLRELL
jgi:hypothetical protein